MLAARTEYYAMREVRNGCVRGVHAQTPFSLAPSFPLRHSNSHLGGDSLDCLAADPAGPPPKEFIGCIQGLEEPQGGDAV